MLPTDDHDNPVLNNPRVGAITFGPADPTAFGYDLAPVTGMTTPTGTPRCPEVVTTKKKVAIVGSAGSTKDAAPFDDEEFEIWGLAWRKDLKRCDRYFDMHPINDDRQRVPDNYKELLAQRGKPTYVIKADPEIPNSITYPLSDVWEHFKINDTEEKYFASSIAYMIALAVHAGFEEIHLYGVDLVDDEEYVYQKPNASYLLGVARGMGIKIYIPPESSLLKHTHVYGYEEPKTIMPLTEEIVRARIAEYDTKHHTAMVKLYTIDGALQELRQQLKLFNHVKRGTPDAPG